MSKLIICKDTHFRADEPFYSAQQCFIKWLSTHECNTDDNSILFLGDIFHLAQSSSKVNSMVIDFIQNKLKFKKIIILSGNNAHEWNSLKKCSAIDILSPLDKVELIFIPTQYRIDNLYFLLLPYINDKSLLPDNFKSMKDYYENLPDNITSQHCDFVSTHIEDHTISFGDNTGIDISYLKTNEFISGHVHKRQENYNLGMPVTSRIDERQQENELLEIDTLTKEKIYISVPKFVDYYDIDYGQEIDLDRYSSKYCIFNVNNCPNSKIAEQEYIDKYKDNNKIYFRSFKNKDTLSTNNLDISQDIKEGITIKKLLNDFFKASKTDKNVQKKIIEIL